MGFLSNLRDRYLISPIAKQILREVKPIEKNDKPDLFAVPVGFNNAMANYNKRMITGGVEWAVLRSLSVNHETTRAAINTRKRQITQLGFDIVDINDDTGSEASVEERKKIKEFITGIGGEGVRFRELLDKLIEDTLVLDACVFYKQRQRNGKLLRIIPVDASTIKLRVGEAGERPLPPEFAFEQWIRGEKVADLTTEDLTYEMMNPRTNTPYGLSPIESLIITLDSSMRAMLYNLSYLSDNTVPQGFLNVPEGWNVAQIKEYTEYLHALISGPKAQAKIYPIPSGATYQATSKPADFAFKDFFDYLDKRVCMMFDLAPQELGLATLQYKENAEGQEKIQVRKGIKPLANFLQEVFTDIIKEEFGYTQFAFKFTGLDSRFSIDEAKTLIPLGVIGVDEVRNDMGLKKLGIKNFILAGNTVIPVDMIDKQLTAITQPNQEPKEKEAPSTEKRSLEKITKNLGLEAVEKKANFKSFYTSIKEGLDKQIAPFGEESVVEAVTEVKKADIDESAIDKELSSVEIEGLEDFLKWAAEQGGQLAYKSLNIEETFKLTNPKFKKMLGDRENYLIKSVDETTKSWIIDQITTGKDAKLTNAEIAVKIKNEMEDITSARANTIVNTEVANAMQVAELDTYGEQGIEKKIWVLSEDIGDQCGENADAGSIALDSAFPSGDFAPPAHPNCRCFIQAEIK